VGDVTSAPDGTLPARPAHAAHPAQAARIHHRRHALIVVVPECSADNARRSGHVDAARPRAL